MSLNKRALAIGSGVCMILACIFFITSQALPSWASYKITSQEAFKEVPPKDLAALTALLTNFLGQKEMDWNSFQRTSGIWRSCISFSGKTMCANGASSCPSELGAFAHLCHKMMTARAFMTIACILSAAAALGLFACTLESMKQHQSLIMIVKAVAVASFVASVIGLGVGIAFTTSDKTPFLKLSIGVASIVAIIGVILNLIGAIVALMLR